MTAELFASNPREEIARSGDLGSSIKKVLRVKVSKETVVLRRWRG